jgi:hypothetical protein
MQHVLASLLVVLGICILKVNSQTFSDGTNAYVINNSTIYKYTLSNFAFVDNGPQVSGLDSKPNDVIIQPGGQVAFLLYAGSVARVDLNSLAITNVVALPTKDSAITAFCGTNWFYVVVPSQNIINRYSADTLALGSTLKLPSVSGFTSIGMGINAQSIGYISSISGLYVFNGAPFKVSDPQDSPAGKIIGVTRDGSGVYTLTKSGNGYVINNVRIQANQPSTISATSPLISQEVDTAVADRYQDAVFLLGQISGNANASIAYIGKMTGGQLQAAQVGSIPLVGSAATNVDGCSVQIQGPIVANGYVIYYSYGYVSIGGICVQSRTLNALNTNNGKFLQLDLSNNNIGVTSPVSTLVPGVGPTKNAGSLIGYMLSFLSVIAALFTL